MNRLGGSALVVVAVAAAFWPALGAGFVNFDDNLALLREEGWRGFGSGELRWMATSFHMGHWHPLTWLSFALDHALWGIGEDAAFGYHLTNVVLHAATALVFLAVARRVLALAGVERPGPPALLAALLFAVHPLRVESVAWVTERRDVLSGVLLLLSVNAWLKRAALPEEDAGRRRAYIAALVFFALSLGAKAWGVTLPVVLLVLDVYPLRRRASPALLIEKLPFFLLAAGAGFLAIQAQGAFGALLPSAQHSLAARLTQACAGLEQYVSTTVVPHDLSPLYLLDDGEGTWSARRLEGVAFVVLVSAGLLWARRRWPAGLAAWAVYVITVAPVLGLTQSGVQTAADRYTYLACLPFALLAAVGLTRLQPPLSRIAPALLVVALAVLTFRQTRVWHDSESLWTRAIEADGENWLAYHLRGRARMDAGDLIGAQEDLSTCIDLRPLYAEAWRARANVHVLRGNPEAGFDDAASLVEVHVEAGRLGEAIADLEQLLRASPPDWERRPELVARLAELRAKRKNGG